MAATGVEIERALAAVTAALNDQKVDDFDTARIQQLVDESVGAAQQLTVDDGGGVHEQNGTRIGAIRRTPSGEWITDRQNPAAERSDSAIPAAPSRVAPPGDVV